MRKHHLPSVDMSPWTIRSPKSSSIRVTSQPRPVASGQLILTSLSASLSPPYTSLQEACHHTSAMIVMMCWQLQSVVVVLCYCNASRHDAAARTASDSSSSQLPEVNLPVQDAQGELQFTLQTSLHLAWCAKGEFDGQSSHDYAHIIQCHTLHFT